MHFRPCFESANKSAYEKMIVKNCRTKNCSNMLQIGGFFHFRATEFEIGNPFLSFFVLKYNLIKNSENSKMGECW